MELVELVGRRVATYYWQHDFNCATTTLKILAEVFSLELQQQVVDAATGMHGAGQYGVQCGLAEGTLMFFGIIGRQKGFDPRQIGRACYDYAAEFESRFGSLNCRTLRPEGFHTKNPPHLCEPLTNKSVLLAIEALLRLTSMSNKAISD